MRNLGFLIIAVLVFVPGSAGSPAMAQSLEGPVSGVPVLSRGPVASESNGYVVEEHFLSGVAHAYAEEKPLSSDGRWQVKPVATAPFVTRLVVARPADASRFNGTVLVEWLNVSGGADASAAWGYLHRELVRSGYVWVGVSAQYAGIQGGAADVQALKEYLAKHAPGENDAGDDAQLSRLALRGTPLKAADAGRYGTLVHPGDAFSYDIFSQAGRSLKGDGVLNSMQVDHLLATGASQSASYLVTYVNAVDPLAQVYDGFLLQVRKKTSAPIDGDVFAALRSSTGPFALDHVRIREDVRVPVLTYISEQDLMAKGLGYLAARQPNTDRIVTWEVAGTSHGDVYGLSVSAIDTAETSISDLANAYAQANVLGGRRLPYSINAAPQGHYVLQAGLDALNRWVSSGQYPSTALPMMVDPVPVATLVLDENGNALGGVRTPWVDVPVAKYSGMADAAGPALSMLGMTEVFDAPHLASLYPGGADDYAVRFEAALDRAIENGFILPEDRAEIVALASEMYPDH